MKKKNILANLIVAIVSILGIFLASEIIFRNLLFSNIRALEKFRDPGLYASFDSDDYWKVFYLLQKLSRKPLKNHPLLRWESREIHPLLGWLSKNVSDSYNHHSADEIGNRRPVLLYGDSFAACATEECFEDILNNDNDFRHDYYLLNYAVGGYGVDQIHLLFKESIDNYNNPFVIISLMTTDMDRSILSVRGSPKPYYEIDADTLKLFGTPIDQNREVFISNNPPQIRSYLYRLFLFGGDYILPNRLRQYLKGNDLREKKKILINKKIIVETIKALEQKQLEYVFLIFHDHYKILRTKDDWRDSLLKQLFIENDVPYISSKEIIKNDDLRTDSESYINYYYLPINGHPSSHQNQVIAKELKRYILKRQIRKTYNFLDNLESAEIITEKADFVSVREGEFRINNDLRSVLLEHPNSEVIFKEVAILDNDAKLIFGIGINEEAWHKQGDGVLFEVSVIDEGGQKEKLFTKYINPKAKLEDRKWFDEMISLGKLVGQNVSFVFRATCGPGDNRAFDWAGWSSPILVQYFAN